MKKTASVFLGLLGGVLLTVVVCWSVYRIKMRPCLPAFAEVSQGRSIDVRLGSRQFGVKVVLIGCEEELNRTFEDGQQQAIMAVIGDMLRSEGWQAWPRLKEEEFRRSLVKKINATLKESVVRDVYLHSFSAVE